MPDFCLLEGCSKCRSIYKLYMNFCVLLEEKFLPGTFRPLIPFFIVFVIFYPRKTRSREVGSNSKFPPSSWNISAPKWNPYSKPSYKSMSTQKFLRWLNINALKFCELHILSEYSFYPTKTGSSRKRNRMNMTMISQIRVVYWGCRSIVGMIFRKVLSFYRLHNFSVNRGVIWK